MTLSFLILLCCTEACSQQHNNRPNNSPNAKGHNIFHKQNKRNRLHGLWDRQHLVLRHARACLLVLIVILYQINTALCGLCTSHMCTYQGQHVPFRTYRLLTPNTQIFNQRRLVSDNLLYKMTRVKRGVCVSSYAIEQILKIQKQKRECYKATTATNIQPILITTCKSATNACILLSYLTVAVG